MESIRSQDVADSVTLVQQYLIGTEPGLGVIERHDIVGLICAECLFLFQIVLKGLSTSLSPPARERQMAEVSLQRSYGRMKMWSDEHKILEGGIDGVLVASRALQRVVLRYLTNIGQILADSRWTPGR